MIDTVDRTLGPWLASGV